MDIVFTRKFRRFFFIHSLYFPRFRRRHRRRGRESKCQPTVEQAADRSWRSYRVAHTHTYYTRYARTSSPVCRHHHRTHIIQFHRIIIVIIIQHTRCCVYCSISFFFLCPRPNFDSNIFGWCLLVFFSTIKFDFVYLFTYVCKHSFNLPIFIFR